MSNYVHILQDKEPYKDVLSTHALLVSEGCIKTSRNKTKFVTEDQSINSLPIVDQTPLRRGRHKSLVMQKDKSKTLHCQLLY